MAPVQQYNKDSLPEEFSLPHTLRDDRDRLKIVDVPVITISATFRRDIAKYFGERTKQLDDVVFSRAHFSMAVAALEQARRMHLTSWLVDPTNYVSEGQWRRVQFTEFAGQVAARIPIIKKLKDILDNLVRSKLPIRKAVTSPLLYVADRIKKPVISFHYEIGNILSKEGKEVLQVVTDPHVRQHYLLEAQKRTIAFAVFDERTRTELLEKARKMRKYVSAKRVFVTGPPVDPRIVAARSGKKSRSFQYRPLRLAIATGGLGTNKGEIEKLLRNIAPEIKKGEVQVLLYASTHRDFNAMFKKIASDFKIRRGKIANSQAGLRIIFEESILEANNKLIRYAFPWADGFVTKPSGDMAYDAVAAGCFILSLSPWGDWEKRIEDIFYSRAILQKADVANFWQQIEKLKSSGWIEQAIKNALEIDRLFLEGTKNIIKLQQELDKHWPAK